MYPYQTSKMIPDFAFALRNVAAGAVEECLPHLRGDFAPFGQFNFDIGFDQDIAVVTMRFKESGIPAGGKMKDEDFSRLKVIIGEARSYSDLKSIQDLDKYFGWDRFLLALQVDDQTVDWHIAEQEVVKWLNDTPLSRAEQFNLSRIQSVLPKPPQYSLGQVQSAMWVLECDKTLIQGTAFDLDHYGTVTNDHVVREVSEVIAFRAQSPTLRHHIRIVSSNSALDLAIIDVLDADRPGPLEIDPNEVGPMAHVAVCGFPNFRLGDSGVLTPGQIVGTRPKSGVLRMLTNAPIVAGMSGGPALGATGKVIGVCVTGSRLFQQAGDTEDHAIIPIAALDLLK